MALLNVITIGHPTLKQVAKPVTVFDDELKRFAVDMIDTMFEEDGIGLAAPQVNRSIRVIAIDLPLADEKYDEPRVFINPEIIESEGTFCIEEGCLSVPEIREEIDRFKRIKVKYQDINGEEQFIEAEDILSVVFQHEIDHLDGILFVDKLGPLKRKMLNQQLNKLKEQVVL
jgi:peptide deformylase